MSGILRESAIPVLDEVGASYLIDPHSSDDEIKTIVVPFSTPEGGRFLLTLEANDEEKEVLIATNVIAVRPGRLAKVAVLLAKLNAQFKYVTFSLDSDAVWVDTCLDLAHTADPASVIREGLDRVVFALMKAYSEILRAVSVRRRPSRVQREAEKILDHLDF